MFDNSEVKCSQLHGWLLMLMGIMCQMQSSENVYEEQLYYRSNVCGAEIATDCLITTKPSILGPGATCCLQLMHLL
jgi:hypothetical protein